MNCLHRDLSTGNSRGPAESDISEGELGSSLLSLCDDCANWQIYSRPLKSSAAKYHLMACCMGTVIISFSLRNPWLYQSKFTNNLDGGRRGYCLLLNSKLSLQSVLPTWNSSIEFNLSHVCMEYPIASIFFIFHSVSTISFLANGKSIAKVGSTANIIFLPANCM